MNKLLEYQIVIFGRKIVIFRWVVENNEGARGNSRHTWYRHRFRSSFIRPPQMFVTSNALCRPFDHSLHYFPVRYLVPMNIYLKLYRMTSILINFKTIVVLIKFNDLIRLHSISPIDRITSSTPNGCCIFYRWARKREKFFSPARRVS